MGSPGCGKTTVGRILGQRLGLPVIDVDNDHLERQWGGSVANKLAEWGDDRFVEEEGKALQSLVASGSVISLTGSNPLHKEAMRHIKQNGILVFLNVANNDILQRLNEMKVNRIVQQSSGITMASLLAQRQKHYELDYDLRVLCPTGSTPEDITDKIVDGITRLDNHSGYCSTRGGAPNVSFNEAILQGLAPDGGLYVPVDDLPSFSLGELELLCDMTYPERALRILERLLHPLDVHPSELYRMVQQAYSAQNFASESVFPLVQLGQDSNQFVVEMFHGPTASFKDGPLQLLPLLFQHAIEQSGSDKKYLILVATSGDTGSAVLSGFGRNTGLNNTKVVVFYPDNGVSSIQRAQMLSATGQNAYVYGIKGDFDYCQTTIKEIFNNIELTSSWREKYSIELSAANSINWGRLVSQIACHISSYAEMVKHGHITMGRKVDVCIPTGNFGNVLSACYAKKMGVPFNKFICASNKNKVLTDFIHTGIYDISNRHLCQTTSPAIDILKSSNLERYLYDVTNRNTSQVKEWFETLDTSEEFSVPKEVLDAIQEDFVADYAEEDESTWAMKDTYFEQNYLLDPHTAVAKVVADRYQGQRNTPLVICGTAHYAKFPEALQGAIDTHNRERPADDVASQFSTLEQMGSHPAMHERLKNDVVKVDQMTCDVIEADQKMIVQTVEKIAQKWSSGFEQ
ncbi:hypothetical protein CAPTEDRAFT_184338 [Capitella teleta]|uniref:Uncharacterized protein n=1 Tax=Capitella teleta TaxID=283909 RepID=R7TU41_CAPTE|nr:hypothetical protein CAPTEDRAFT_184338 [Capitella teleta]|eukprot:ELT94976.1 hypothetical protein CAPTEDRAFT_184338 [Capitella teleta]